MRRQRTVSVGRDEVDFMVLEYSCIDNSVLSSIGQHSKETTWKIAAGNGSMPIDIRLHVDKKVITSPQVSIEWDGKKIFPSGSSEKAKLKEDFTWTVPFRGMVKGIAVKDYYEIRPEHLGMETWYTATLIEQREDGLFKALAQIPDGNGGIKEVNYPAVKRDNIRESAGMKKGISVPQRNLVLQVPRQDPLHAVVLVDEGELITHFFARPTPPPSKDARDGAKLVKPRILFKVSKDRQRAVTDVGHSVLTHFLSGEVRSVRQEATRWKKSWTIQVGPFAEHTIELERRYKLSKILTLTVDGDLLCEALPEDIESRADWWEAMFRLVGERYLDWEVHESDVHGNTLNTIDLVRQKQKYTHECCISFQEGDKDLTAARFTVDDRDFMDLPEAKALFHEDKLDCEPEALQGSYGLTVPHKINEDAPTGFSAWTNNVRSPKPGSESGFFFRCCGSPQVGRDDMVMSR
mmetsp:Transcript_8560/g.19475  ORF Transcript_8560/g.19475 Transcript_8560/m.19475 type:complete len:463 (-) Transcript_8560:128-1516(-)